jgi:predicted dehydrogenase
LFTAFHRRYNAELAALRQRLIGRPPVRRVIVRYQERIEDHLGSDYWYLDPSRCGGGCLADNGPNAFDMARRLVGPMRVTRARIGWDAGVDRSATVDLIGSSGAVVRVELDWSFPGERKEIEVQLADGSAERADLLRGHPEFKGSLWHEYVGVLADFGAQRPGSPNPGLDSVRLVADAYAAAR